MRYVTYESESGPRVGRLDGEQVVDVGFDGDMIAFIEADAPHRSETGVGTPRLLAPLRPRSLRDFLTFRGHLEHSFSKLGRQIPDEWWKVPAYAKGLPQTVIGPEEEVPWPWYTNQLDYELEIACVIGKEGRNISQEDAHDHIFGWTIWNDISARDIQGEEMAVGMGPSKCKDWDGSNVLGPCIVTTDELDGMNAAMEVRVNGDVWGNDNSANMHHKFPTLVAYASRSMTLRAGEVMGSGTAAGGSGMEIGRWIQAGDVVELEIEGIGVLRNRIGKKEQ